MRSRLLTFLALTVVSTGLTAGCVDDETRQRPDDTASDDVLDVTDAAPDTRPDDGTSDVDARDTRDVADAGDAGDAAVDSMETGPETVDGTADAVADGDTSDAGDDPVRSCGTLPEPSDGLCSTQSGSGDLVVLRGDVLTEDRVYDNGTVVVDRSEENATITCTGCDCSDTIDNRDPTVVSCPEGVVSPGLINPHDHLGWATNGPWEGGEERYNHRHEWRTGARDKTEISSPGGDFSRTSILHGELRHLFGGATSIAGSTSGSAARGLLRNLDNPEASGGIDVTVDYSTFPLGDVRGTLLDGSCNYNGRSSNGLDPYSVLRNDIYLPHIAEGIDGAARNEFSCLSDFGDESRDLVEHNTSVVHGIGMTALDVRELAAEGGQLVWSPRTNIALYGQTAQIGVYRSFDVPVALGTDWSISGSRNMLSELACADSYDREFRGDQLSDRQLWKMATINSAVALGAEDRLGRLRAGHVADIAVFDGRDHGRWSGVVKASDSDVRLVVRGGEPLYGDADLVETLTPDSRAENCSTVDVCGTTRRACVGRDTADHSTPVDFSTLREAGASDAYPLFACESDDVREPTCTPKRPGEYDGSVSESDVDGDGVPDGEDTCPAIFDPGRPLSGGDQPDTDRDGLGDACDPCPTRTGDQCDVDDWDNDGVPNDQDNCPFTRNRGQGDGDTDGVGDACDRSTTPYAISNDAHAAGEEVLLEDVVVTAVDDDPRFPGIFVQMPPDDSRYRGREHGGVFVYLGGDPVPDRGDLIDLRGRVDEHRGLTQVSGVSELEVNDQNHVLPDPVVVDPCAIRTGGSRAEALRGSLVRVEDVDVTDANPDGPNDDFGEFTVGDCGSGEDLRVDDQLHVVQPDPKKGDAFRSITGPLHYAFGNAKVEPRDADDVVFGPAPLAAVEPPRAYLKNGTTAVPTPTFEVALERPAEKDRRVQLDYGSSGLVDGPSSITFSPGEDRLVVTLDGLQVSADKSDVATVTASTSNSQASNEVLVYDDSLSRSLESMDAVAPLVRPGQTFDVTVRLDIPASSGGSSIPVSTDSDLSLPSTDPVVAAGELETTFQVDAGSNTGNKTLTATLGSSSVSTTVNVQSGPTGACLVVSEYIEGSGYNNKAIELFNCSARQLDLGNFGVCTAFNSNTSCGDHTGLDDSVTLDPGEVHTLCRKTSGTSGDPVADIAQNCDQTDSDVVNFNGNDRVLVFEDENDDGTYQDGQDAIVDMFGEVENPPSGSPWKDVTYRRCRLEPYVGSSSFAVGDYYTEHPENDASHYGTPPSTSSCP